MESRRVQRVGASTLAVSLPRDWVKTVGLKKGDIVFLTQDEDGALKVMAAKQRVEEPSRMIEVNADLCKDLEMLYRVLAGCYALGYDVIKVVSTSRLGKRQIETVRRVVQKMMGIGIVEEAYNQITIQCLMDVTKFPIDTLIRRLYVIASTMHREVTDALSNFDVSIAEEASRRKNEAEMMFRIIIRILDNCQEDRVMAKKMNIDDSMQILWCRLAAQYLRLTADWAEKAAKKVTKLEKYHEIIGEYLLKKIIEISERSYGICSKAVDSFFSNDINLASHAIENYNEIQKAEEQLQEAICRHTYLHSRSFAVSKYFKGKEPIEPCMLAQISFIIWSIRRIAELGAEIAEIAIHKALSKHTKLIKKIQKQDNSKNSLYIPKSLQ